MPSAASLHRSRRRAPAPPTPAARATKSPPPALHSFPLAPARLSRWADFANSGPQSAVWPRYPATAAAPRPSWPLSLPRLPDASPFPPASSGKKDRPSTPPLDPFFYLLLSRMRITDDAYIAAIIIPGGLQEERGRRRKEGRH